MSRLSLKEGDIQYLLAIMDREQQSLEFDYDDEEYENKYRARTSRIYEKLLKALPPLKVKINNE